MAETYLVTQPFQIMGVISFRNIFRDQWWFIRR